MVLQGKHSSGVLSSREEAQLLRSSVKGGKVSSEGDELFKEGSWPESLPTSSGQGSDERKGAPLIVGELWRARTIGILDDVEIKQLIGRGSFGSVYKGNPPPPHYPPPLGSPGPPNQTFSTTHHHPTYQRSTKSFCRKLEGT